MADLQFGKLFQNASEGEEKAAIIGQLPDWLFKEKFQVIYNGPAGIWDHRNGTVNHWFDGLSILVSLAITTNDESTGGGGKCVALKKKFLDSEAYQKALTHGKLISTEYGTAGSKDPDKGLMSSLVSSIIPGEMTENCACNVYQLGGGLVVSTETCLLRRLDPETLESPSKIDLSGMVNIACARALTDPKTKEVFNLAGTFLTGLKYHFIRFPPSNELQNQKELLSNASIVATIGSRMTTCFSYYHSFGLTEKYLIMIEQPWVANSIKLATSKMKGNSFYDCLDWLPQERNVFHIIDRNTGKPVLAEKKLISQESFFFLNFINCHDDDDSIVIDLVAYDSPEILHQMFLEKLREGKLKVEDKSKILRFIIPLNPSGDIGNDLICSTKFKSLKASAILNKKKIILSPHMVCPERGCEHPAINRKFQGRRYKFSYVIGWLESVNSGPFANALSKINMETGEIITWTTGNGFCHPAEALFIPRTKELDDNPEDDGLIVATVTDVREDHKDFFVFLEASTMTEIARVNFKESIPFTSHAYLHRI